MTWGQRARLAARRAREAARAGAGRARQAVGEAAEKLRGKGRRAAQHDLPLLEMALPDKLREQSVNSTLHRTRGPRPDPAWVAGYRQAVVAREAGRGGREAGG